MCDAEMVLEKSSRVTQRSNVFAATSYSMTAEPMASDVVAGFSCAALIVARNSTTWPRVADANANTPAVSRDRMRVFIWGDYGHAPATPRAEGTKRNRAVTAPADVGLRR